MDPLLLGTLRIDPVGLAVRLCLWVPCQPLPSTPFQNAVAAPARPENMRLTPRCAGECVSDLSTLDLIQDPEMPDSQRSR